MSVTRNSAVLWEVPQSLEDNEQAQARENINAAKNAVVTNANNGLMSTTDKNKLDGIAAGAEVNVQSDWNQSDNTADDYIKNKPTNLVQDASYVHTDNNFTTTLKDKLDGIAAGAEVNVQADWNQTDNTADDYIKNKPTNLVQDASYVHTDNNFTTALKDKLDGIEADAEVNVQSDWNQTDNTADDYIKNKPTNLVQDASYVHTDNNFTTTLKDKLDGIAAGAEVNVQADWNQVDNTADDYIKNKPSNLVQDASYVHTDNNFTTTLKDKLDGIAAEAEVNVQADWSQSDNTADDYIKNKPVNLVQDASYVHTDNNFTTTLKDKLDGIAAGAEVNVQADWSQSDNTADDYIKNKPSNLVQDASYVHTDNNFTTTLKNKLDGIAAGAEVNVQADWSQSDNTADDYIKNKPNVPEIVMVQNNQGSSSEHTVSKMSIDQDFGTVTLHTNSDVDVGYLVPNAPSGFSTEQVLKLIPGNSNPTWSTAPKEIFPVVYGTTTLTEISTALSNGKIPILSIGYGRYALLTKYSSGSAAWFTTVAMEGSLLSVAAQNYMVTPDGWATDPNRMNGNDHFHLPNIQTAKVKVEVVDTIPTWLTIGGIIIGGMATSGGNISIRIKAVTTSSGGTLSRDYIYDTLFRTNSTTDTTDNAATFGLLSANGTTWTNLYTISQYSGTHTVECKLEANLFDTSSATPNHYNLKFHKIFSGDYTWMYISATHNWGDPD